MCGRLGIYAEDREQFSHPKIVETFGFLNGFGFRYETLATSIEARMRPGSYQTWVTICMDPSSGADRHLEIARRRSLSWSNSGFLWVLDPKYTDIMSVTVGSESGEVLTLPVASIGTSPSSFIKVYRDLLTRDLQA